MPMGIVSDSDFNSELNNSSQIKREVPITIPKPTAEVKELPTKGRGEGNVEVPDALRKVIGEESVINGRESAIELAKSFGLSDSSVSAYANGSTSTATYDKNPNIAHLLKAKERISKRARKVLVQSLNHITNEKLEVAKVVEVAAVARAMSAIVKDMEPPQPKSVIETNGGGPTFVFYSPQTRKEETFDMVHVKE